MVGAGGCCTSLACCGEAIATMRAHQGCWQPLGFAGSRPRTPLPPAKTRPVCSGSAIVFCFDWTYS